MESGSLWRDRIAPLMLPILLWAAMKGKKISYKQVAEELQRRHGEVIKRRMTLYGKPAGKIGDALRLLSEEWGVEIPPINTIMVRGDKKGLPGDGANPYIARYLTATALKRMTDSNRDALAREVIEAVYDYTDWDKVRRYFNLGILKVVPALLHSTEPPIKLPKPKPARGGPESPAHKELKMRVSAHPELFAKLGKFAKGKEEAPLSSGDEVDVLFRNKDTQLAVEVKHATAPESEYVRGLFQCVKYRATIRAMQLAAGAFPNAQAVLVVGRPLSAESARLATRLRVMWMAIG
jgi:hypothetical protein